MPFTTALTLAIALTAGSVGEPSDSLGKTPPASWSTDGWSVFRWRMGPGDVRAALLTLDNPLHGATVEATKDKYEVTVSARSTTLVIAGEPMDVRFSFFEGKLYIVYLAPRDNGGGWLWRRKVRALLSEKYGSPQEQEGAFHWFFAPPRELGVALLAHSAIIYVEPAALSRLSDLQRRDKSRAEQENAEAERRRQADERNRRLQERTDLKNL